jgi:gluconolactonase
MTNYPEKLLAEGFAFPEGPAFDDQGILYICELANRRVTRILEDGKWEVVADMGGSPNGLAFGPDGIGYIANGGGRWAAETCTGGKFGNGDSQSLIQRLHPDGSFDTFIEEIDGTPLNSPNDLCFDQHGGFYFTDPVWPNFEDPDSRNSIPNGAVCYATTDGKAVRCTTDVRFPNGLGVTDDGSTLLVCDSFSGTLMAFDITGPGEVSNGRHFCTLQEGIVSDGMCFDSSGRVLVAGHGSGRIWVFAPEGGDEPETVIEVQDKDITNLCFGGPDFSTIYTTESDHGRVTMIEWDRPGMKLFPDRR